MRAASAMTGALDLRMNSLIDKPAKHAEHPLLHLGTEVYFALGPTAEPYEERWIRSGRQRFDQ